ncbi:MAG: DUF190 domain-containing protein [Gammaproteobacteria bacterium]|nr:DUF190 domain-containing protein [Gammaproteobacteria bacterium]
MKTIQVTMARVYVTEGKGLKPLLKYLHDESKVRGVTVFRGITGFGKSGTMHSSTLIDMSLDLPVVIEFFDTPDRAVVVLRHLNTLVKPGHIVTWPAEINED